MKGAFQVLFLIALFGGGMLAYFNKHEGEPLPQKASTTQSVESQSQREVTSQPSAAEQTCLVVSSGNKLCGQDAVAWCDAYISGGTIDGSPAASHVLHECQAVQDAARTGP